MLFLDIPPGLLQEILLAVEVIVCFFLEASGFSPQGLDPDVTQDQFFGVSFALLQVLCEGFLCYRSLLLLLFLEDLQQHPEAVPKEITQITIFRSNLDPGGFPNH